MEEEGGGQRRLTSDREGERGGAVGRPEHAGDQEPDGRRADDEETARVARCLAHSRRLSPEAVDNEWALSGTPPWALEAQYAAASTIPPFSAAWPCFCAFRWKERGANPM